MQVVLQHQIQFQLSKVKHACGESSTALIMLEQDETVVNHLLSLEEADLNEKFQACAGGHTNINGYPTDVFVQRLLTSTKWMIESGTKSGVEIMNRFKLSLGIRPKWEKSHFLFARYLDSVFETKVTSLIENQRSKQGIDEDSLREWAIGSDCKCRGYLLDAMQSYLRALSFGDKHLLQAMPRLLTIWFDLTAVKEEMADVSDDACELLRESQIKANKLIRESKNNIPSFSFYSALPQLISRVSHRNEGTSMLVRKILMRVLSKFPEQGMWPLAWLVNSTKVDRANIGAEIFNAAQKYQSQQGSMKFHDLLVESKSLFKFLIDLARYKPKNSSCKTFRIKPWRGSVDLIDFVPPVSILRSVIKFQLFSIQYYLDS